MTNQIQAQATKVWKTVSDPATTETYQKTSSVTLLLLKEIAYLFWLIFCLVLVFGEWFWKTAYRSGSNFRSWLNNLEKPTTDRLLSETGKALLSAGQSSVTLALTTAKEQLGMEAEAKPAEPATPSKSTLEK
jgi:hypothetical protein